jgi:hypothetical protein
MMQSRQNKAQVVPNNKKLVISNMAAQNYPIIDNTELIRPQQAHKLYKIFIDDYTGISEILNIYLLPLSSI